MHWRQRLLKSQSPSPWHTFSSMATPLNPFKTIPQTGDQLLKQANPWGTFLFKSPQKVLTVGVSPKIQMLLA